MVRLTKLKTTTLSVLLLFIFLLVGGRSACALELKPDAPRLLVSPEMSYFRISAAEAALSDRSDVTTGFTLAHAMNLPLDAWSSLSANPNFGASSDTLWFKLDLTSPVDLRRVLEIDRPYIDIVNIYLVSDGELIQQFLLGDHRPFSDRPISSTNIQVPLSFQAGHNYSLYVEVITHGLPLQFQATLWEPGAASASDNYYLAFYAALAGAALIIGFYNAFIFFSTRDVNYLLYTAIVLTITFNFLNIQGYVFQFSDSAVGAQLSFVVAVAAMAYRIFISLFAISFLQLSRIAPVFRWVFIYFLISDFILLFSVLFRGHYNDIFVLAVLNSMLIFPATFVAALWCWYKGLKEARFTVFAWGIYTFCLARYFYSLFGSAPYDPAVGHWVAVGIMTEMVLLALALADRLNSARQAQQQLNSLKIKTVEDEQRLLQTRNDLLNSQLEQVKAQRKAEEADLASKAKSEFLATMSHEIRTPMNGVLGMAELLQDTELNETQYRFVKTINDSGQSLLTVINDILDFSKIEAGSMTVEEVDFDLEALIDSCLEIFALRCMEKKLQLVACMAPGVPQPMRGDPTRIRQIILNLIGNAVKFTNEGEITLKVLPIQVRELDAEGSERDHFDIRFEITDTGIGIEDEHKAKLFKSFTQADASITREYGGTGLGLSISKLLVELMGGRIGLNSELGVGSTFYFELPYHPPQEDFAFTIPRYLQQLKGRQVLIIDDNATFAEFCQLSCKSWQLKADIAYSGEQALEKLHVAQQNNSPYEVLILDVILPDTDGYNLYQKILTDNAIEMKPKVVFISAMQLAPRDIEDVIHHQIHNAPYLEKPIASGRMREVLADLLTDQSPQSLQARLPLRAEQKVSNLQHLRVLVAEDSAVNRMVISGQLQKMHIYADFVENGRQAIEAVRRLKEENNQSYNLILMDCEMPDIDGYSATREIRKISMKGLGDITDPNQDSRIVTRKTVILALTAMLTEQVEKDVVDAGMDGYMSKPIGLDKLSKKITSYFSEVDRLTPIS
jgi:signal transduction histidine kinase/DNA-binding response OmpR family regulator